MNQTMTKEFVAEAAINPQRIVKFGTTDDFMAQSAAAADGHIGVFEGYGTAAPLGAAAGERIHVTLSGIARLKLGGTVARSAGITSDATGQGVAAGAGNRAIGYALASGVVGDVIPVLLAPHTV
jgi:Uncharacterized conserved protein (DUF2190)